MQLVSQSEARHEVEDRLQDHKAYGVWQSNRVQRGSGVCVQYRRRGYTLGMQSVFSVAGVVGISTVCNVRFPLFFSAVR